MRWTLLGGRNTGGWMPVNAKILSASSVSSTANKFHMNTIFDLSAERTRSPSEKQKIDSMGFV